MTLEITPRACLRQVTPYLPGKPIGEVQREMGLRRVVKLASNENPLGPSPRAVIAARRAVSACARYPEGASPLLRRALARHLDVAESQVLVANGSDEVIRLLCEAFLSPDDEVVVSRHGFIRFKQQSMLMGAKVIEVPMAGWTHDLAVMARAVSARTKLVFAASPNNPTATWNSREELEAMLRALPKTALLVLDEAYCHYAAARPEYPDAVRELVHRHPNLVVLRTFSKAYGLAGLRVGYGVGDPELVGWLDRIRMPFNVSLPAQEAALEALADAAHVRRSVASNERNRRTLAAGLRAAGLEVGESATNFLFVQSPVPGAELFRRLLAEGVIVRPLDEYGLPRHVRISVGSAAENRRLLAGLRKALRAGEPAEAR